MTQQDEGFQGRFPFRFHVLLSQVEQAGLAHIMSWLPCGTMFKIHDRKGFTNEIMPKIGRCTRYKSFLRQLSIYKFRRITQGPMKGAYHHPYFLRDRIGDCRGVVRGLVFNTTTKNDHNANESSRSSSSSPSKEVEHKTTKGTQEGARPEEEERIAQRVRHGNGAIMVPTAVVSGRNQTTPRGERNSFEGSEEVTTTAAGGTTSTTTTELALANSGIIPLFYSSTAAPRRQFVDEEVVEPLSPEKRYDANSWFQDDDGVDEIEHFSSRKLVPSTTLPAGGLPVLSIFPEDKTTTCSVVMSTRRLPLAELGGAEETWHFNSRRENPAVSTEDIIDEIISTFARNS